MIRIPRRRRIARPRLGDIQRFGLSGRLRAILTDIHTGEIQRYLNHNIITRVGLATIPPSIFEAREFYVTQLGVGSGLTDPADTDSGLTTEVLVKAITLPRDDSNLTGATPYSIVTVQFDPGEANGNLTEAGLFDSDDALFNHALFGRGSVVDATQTDPVNIESTAHGLSNGDRVRFDGVGGMTELNFVASNYYYVSVVDVDNFELFEDSALSSGLDGTGFGAFTSGGNWTVSIPKTSSNILQVSFEIQAQNA